MKIDLQSQNPLEWLALQTGLIPKPVLLAHFGFMITKVLGEAVECGVLEAIAQKQQTPAAIAAFCKLNEKAVTALLGALTGMKILTYRNEKFALTPASKKWLIKESNQSYTSQLLFDSKICYNWLHNTGDYLRTGKGLQYHNSLQPAEWRVYQDGMAATAGLISKVAAAKIKLPAAATQLLDIGGAHGLYSAALLKKYPQLSAQVLDLPEAIAANATKDNPYPDRLQFTPGNVLKNDLPPEKYDAVIMVNVAHHFTAEENLLVGQKVLTALKPGGNFYILEFFKKDMVAASSDTIGALQSFFFSLSSTSGLWTADDIKSWFIRLGYRNTKLVNFVQLPGFGFVSGRKG